MTSIRWVVPNQGVTTRTVFLLDFALKQEILGQGARPIGSAVPRYSPSSSTMVAPDGEITLLAETLTAARAISDAYASYPIATLVDDEAGINFRHRVINQINITPVRIGNVIRRWQLEFSAVAQ